MRLLFLFTLGLGILTACRSVAPVKDSTSSLTPIYQSSLAKPPQELFSVPVILVGEVHYYTPLESYTYLFETFTDPAKPNLCLAVEFPVSTDPFETILDKVEARAKSDKVNVPNLMKAVHYYRKINAVAVLYKIKIFPVDTAVSTDIEVRNKSMGENIAKLIRNKTCDRVIGIFGKAHHTMGAYRTMTVKSVLMKLKVAALSVNMQMTNEEGLDLTYKSFASSGLSAESADYIWVKTSELAQPVRVLPNLKGDVTVWQEFDYSLLLPSDFKPVRY